VHVNIPFLPNIRYSVEVTFLFSKARSHFLNSNKVQLLQLKGLFPRSTSARRFNDAPICIETVVKALWARFMCFTHTVLISKLHVEKESDGISEELKQIVVLK
jgi:hypothetical protein